MGIAVVAGAQIMCSFGQGVATLMPTSQVKLSVSGKLQATIKDAAPLVNIGSCGMCISMQNPQVAAATAAALGVLTPQPCVPSLMGTWQATQTKCQAGGIPCLIHDSSIMCAYGGRLSIVNPGQGIVKIQ